MAKSTRSNKKRSLGKKKSKKNVKRVRKTMKKMVGGISWKGLVMEKTQKDVNAYLTKRMFQEKDCFKKNFSDFMKSRRFALLGRNTKRWVNAFNPVTHNPDDFNMRTIYGKGEYDDNDYNINSRDAMTERPGDFSVEPEKPPIVIEDDGVVAFLPGETQVEHELRTKGTNAHIYAEAAANTYHDTQLYDNTIPEVSRAIAKNEAAFKANLKKAPPPGALDPSKFDT